VGQEETAQTTDPSQVPSDDTQDSLTDDALGDNADEATEDEDTALEPLANAPAGSVVPKDTTNTALTGGVYYTLIPKNSTTRVLDVNGSSSANGANISLWQANLGTHQNFRFVSTGDGYFTIVAEHSGKLVDVEGASTKAGANILQWSGHSGINQKWYFTLNSDSSYTIHSALGTAGNDLVMDIAYADDSNGANLTTYRNNGQAHQHFTLRPAYPKSNVSVASGYYQMELSYATGKVLDIPGSSTAEMINPIVYTKNSATAFNQTFKLTQVGDYYTIQAAVSGLYLDVSGSSRALGAAIVQYSYHGGDNQLWALISSDGGKTVTLYSKSTGAVIDVPGSSTTNSTKPTMYLYHGGTNQRFKLLSAVLPAAPVLSNGYYSILSTANNTLAFDVPGGSRLEKTGLIAYDYHAGINQKFKITTVAANTYTIASLCSGLYLTDTNSAVVQRLATGGNEQRWQYLSGAGGYQLKNVGTGKVLGLTSAKSNTNLQTVSEGLATSLVGLSFAKKALLEDSYYVVKSRLGAVLGVQGSSLQSGAAIVAGTDTGANSQKFFIRKTSDISGNTYTLATALIGKFVDASDGVSVLGTQVLQNPYSGGNNQLWEVLPTDDGWFFIKSKLGDAYLTIIGSAIATAPGNGSDAQKFSFTSTTYVRALLDGIDVSSWQPSDIGWRVDYDFMIVKATGGVSYTNPSFKAQADAALTRGKQLGLYHYAAEYQSQNSPEAEAAYFVSKIGPYSGNAVLFLDYEEDMPGSDRVWITAFCKEVKRLTGVSCHIYASGSWANNYISGLWSDLGVMLWQANYWNSTLPNLGYRQDIAPMVPCSVYQYTSQGRLPGYTGSLDLNVFYGTTTDWAYWTRP
jgi:GH25 family lysozyme M1 (1,4-beta-N-acetylmuramidase)